MAAVNFPDPSASPWTNPDNGVTYEYSNNVWSVLKVDPTDFDFVKLDDGGVKQVLKSAGLGISNGTTENITLNADGDVDFKGNIDCEDAVFSGKITAGIFDIESLNTL